jgi:uncharacterized protein (DUF488 family)
MDQEPLTLWTIGHSTRSGDEFNEILSAQGIEAIADVRAFPTSRRYPQFNRENLAKSLSEAGIEYQHLPALGGRRKPSANSRNTAWKNSSFRAYADYMETESFRQGIESLLGLARCRRTGVMCAEAVWWRCHRSLIADYLKAQGLMVIHITSANRTEVHRYTAAASIVEGKLSYAGLLHEAEPKVTS